MTCPASQPVSTLEVDVGNTRLKWRRVDATGRVLDVGSCSREGGAAASQLAAEVARQPCRAVRVVSVAGPEFDEALRAHLVAAGIEKCDFVRSCARHGSLVSGYEEPERLGADRWAALAAAAAQADDAFAVLDAGSAITFDQVASDGRHEGGWIVPGLGLMRAALLRDTAGVRYVEVDDAPSATPGSTTAAAVLGGTLHMARDFARRRWDAFRRARPHAVLFVTGGDGPILAEGLEGEVRLCPDLVLDGLRELVP